MKIRVLLFAQLRELARTGQLELDLPEPVSVGGLREELLRRIPRGRGLLERSSIAVAERIADEASVIPPGVEVAVIPPVSGG